MMNEEGSSSVDPPQQQPAEADIPPEDKAAIAELYQRCPKLWGAFRDILCVVDLLATRPQADRKLLSCLQVICKHAVTYANDEDVFRFTAVSGFVEKGVAFARRILRDQGRSYVTEFPSVGERVFTDMDTACLHMIRIHILNCTVASADFSLRLTKTGFLHDLVEDLKHIQHLSVEALERGDVFLLSVGTINNCCVYPDSAAAVRELDIVPHITPFLTKRGQNQLIQSIAAAVVAHVAEDDQLDLLVMDTQLLQYFLKRVEVALDTNQTRHSHWTTREVLCDMRQLARNDFNKRLMVAQGTLHTVRAVLDPTKKRSEKEKQQAVSIVCRLIEDQTNLHICQNDQELLEVLKSLQRYGPQETSEMVQDLLTRLEPCHTDAADLEDHVQAFPHLARLLADKCNVLSILRMGLVEFVLAELKVLTGQQGHGCLAVRGNGQGLDCEQVLIALRELATDDMYQREIMARGVLDLVTTVLRTGTAEEKTEAASAVLALTEAEENRPVIQIHADLITILENARQRGDNPGLASLSENILQAIGSLQ